MRILVRVVGVIAALGLLLAAVPLSAHHSFAAAFDENKPVNLQGTVTKVELVNPHAWIWLDVKGADGKVTNWGIEGGPPTNLLAERHHQEQPAGRRRDQAVRLSGQERRAQGRRRVRRVSRRPQDLHGRLGSRRRRQHDNRAELRIGWTERAVPALWCLCSVLLSGWGTLRGASRSMSRAMPFWSS